MPKATSDDDFIERLKVSREKKTSGETLEERAAKINQDSHMIMNTPPPTTGVSRSDVLEKLKKERGDDTPNASDVGQKDTVVEVTDVQKTTGIEEVEIPVDLIDPSPYQPRIQIDEEKITELGASLASGQINAIIVRPVKGRYELICGERRWRAMQSIGRKTIRAIIRPMSDTDADIEALVDNDAREDLTSFERGVRYKAALDKKLVKNAASLARRVGKKELEISRCLSFFKLPVEVLPLLNQRPGFLSARAVTDFLPYVENNDQDLVIVAITKVFDGMEVTAALNWLKAESRARHTPAAKSHIQEYTIDGRTLGSMRVDGRRVVITCAPGVSPDELISTILLTKPGSVSNG